MPLTLNNSKDVICDKVYLLDTNGILQDVSDLIANGGGGGGGGSGGITTLTGSGAAVITWASASTNILVDSSMYSTITQINNMLSSSSLILQVGGVTQNATTLNFVQNNSLLSGGVLNISRLNQYDKIPLIHPTHSSVTDFKQDASGGLAWGTDIMTTNNYLTSVLASYATTATLSNYTNTTALNTLLSAYTNTTALNTLFSAYTNTTTLSTLLSSYTSTTALNTL